MKKLLRLNAEHLRNLTAREGGAVNGGRSKENAVSIIVCQTTETVPSAAAPGNV